MAGEAGGVAKAIAIEKRGGLWLGGNGPEGDVYHVKLRISSHEISAALRSNPLCGLWQRAAQQSLLSARLLVALTRTWNIR